MRFKPKPITIDEKDPFREDLLSRHQCAEVLTDFVGSLTEPFVLAIDSPWGTGKTTFLKMWLQCIRNQGFHCLYFNAWENDFTESPLISLIGEVGAEIEAAKLGDNQKTIAELFQRTKRVGATLFKAAAPTVLKLATSGVVDLTGLKGEDIGKLAEDLARKQIEKYQADKKTIQRFRGELSTLVAALAGSSGGPSKPVIFVVDELDRCRPPYAVELLEKIKHLFSVEGLVFVLAIDRQQLGESVKSMYGAGMNSEGYLRRFIDLQYQLPEPTPEAFVNAQFGRFGLDEILQTRLNNDYVCIPEILPHLFPLLGFSLRTQEQCFTQIALVLRTTPPNHHLFPYLLCILLCLRTANRPLYNEYCRGTATPEGVMKYLRSLPAGKKFAESHPGFVTEAHLIFGIRSPEQRYAAIKACRELAESKTADETQKRRASEVSTMFRWLPNADGDITGYIFNKLELVHRFVKPDGKVA